MCTLPQDQGQVKTKIKERVPKLTLVWRPGRQKEQTSKRFQHRNLEFDNTSWNCWATTNKSQTTNRCNNICREERQIANQFNLQAVLMRTTSSWFYCQIYFEMSRWRTGVPPTAFQLCFPTQPSTTSRTSSSCSRTYSVYFNPIYFLLNICPVWLMGASSVLADTAITCGQLTAD